MKYRNLFPELMNKILYITPHLSTGGLPQYLYKKLESVSKDENNNIFLIEWEDLSPIYRVQKDLIKNIIHKSNFVFWEQGTSVELKIKHIINFIRGSHFDIIHLEEFPEYFLPTSLINYIYKTEGRSYKIIETSHNSGFPVEDKQVFPDAFIFVSQHQIEKYKSFNVLSYLAEYPIEKKTRPNREESLKKLGLDSDYKHVLNVGLFTPGKNQGYAFKIAQLLEIEKIRFHFIGNQAGNFEDYWVPLMQNKPNNCIIYGERSDVDNWYSACDLLLFTSTSELNPLVPREALSWTLPVLMNNLDIYQHEYDQYVNYLTNDLFKDSNIVKKLIGLPFENIFGDELSKTQVKEIPDQTNSFISVFDIAYNNAKIRTDCQPKIQIDKPIKVNFNFFDGPFAEVLGGNDDIKYTISFYDQDKLVHEDILSSNHYSLCYRKWFTYWNIKIKSGDELIFEHKFDLKGKKVLISFESSSLGDTLAWIPYVEEFRLKHDCEVFCSTFWNNLYENSYPEIKFIKPGKNVDTIYAGYKIGCYIPQDDHKWHPIDWRTIPLQKVASDILGLDYREIKPRIDIPDDLGTSENDLYVSIGIHTTCQAKYWNYPNGWQKLVGHLDSIGYKVMHISKERGTYMGNEPPRNVLDKTGDNSIKLRIRQILNSKMFIGISSGLSWLAWALNVPTIMISGVTKSFNEPDSMIKIHNSDVCNGCFNNTNYNFDKGNWKWCPDNQNFICSKLISPEDVIKKIDSVLLGTATDEQSKSVIFTGDVYREVFEWNQYTNVVKINNNDTVLDLGCSKGYLYFKCISENLNINYIGIDASIFNFKDFIENLKGDPNPILLNLAIDQTLKAIDFGCMFHLGSHQLTQSITFPNLLKLINKPIDFLKFDIEGYEKYIFEDYDLFKSKINKFAGEIHFRSNIFPKYEVYKLLTKLKNDPEIEVTLFAINMVDITESIWDNSDYYSEIIINGQVK